MPMDFGMYLVRSPSLDEDLCLLQDWSNNNNNSWYRRNLDEPNGQGPDNSHFVRLDNLKGCISCATEAAKVGPHVRAVSPDFPYAYTPYSEGIEYMKRPSPYDHDVLRLSRSFTRQAKIELVPRRGPSDLSPSRWSDSQLELVSKCRENVERSERPKAKKRRVSFADESGLPLAQVKVFEKQEHEDKDILSLKKQAPYHLNGLLKPKGPMFVPTFPTPTEDFPEFIDKLQRNQVVLENVMIEEDVVMGTVRVMNLAFCKEVTVRCTCDSWKTLDDISTTYVPGGGSCAIAHDTFGFMMPIDRGATEMEFAICFKTSGKEYWDNNGGQNYKIVLAVKSVDTINPI